MSKIRASIGAAVGLGIAVVAGHLLSTAHAISLPALVDNSSGNGTMSQVVNSGKTAEYVDWTLTGYQYAEGWAGIYDVSGAIAGARVWFKCDQGNYALVRTSRIAKTTTNGGILYADGARTCPTIKSGGLTIRQWPTSVRGTYVTNCKDGDTFATCEAR